MSCRLVLVIVHSFLIDLYILHVTENMLELVQIHTLLLLTSKDCHFGV